VWGWKGDGLDFFLRSLQNDGWSDVFGKEKWKGKREGEPAPLFSRFLPFHPPETTPATQAGQLPLRATHLQGIVEVVCNRSPR